MEANRKDLYKFLGKGGKTRPLVIKYLMDKLNWKQASAKTHIDVLARWGVIISRDGLYFRGDAI